MAEISLVFTFFCVFSLFVSVEMTRELSNSAVLDVSEAMRNTAGVFSFDSEAVEESKVVESDSSKMSFKLHARVGIKKVSSKDYKSLTLARLARDSARVNSLNTKVELAVSGVRKADLKPVEAEFGAEDLATPVVSGTSQGSGEYFTRVGIGRPAKQFYMVLDTGSDINWLQCEPCTDCYQQADPIFQPSSSTSYSSLTCAAQQCQSLEVSACRSGSCLYQVAYGDGSYTVGDFVTESVTFGNSGSVDKVAIGCGHDNEGLFVGAAGLLGLGGGPLSFVSQIKATSFSYCLVDRDSKSSSSLDFNSAFPTDSVTAQLLRNKQMDTFFYVGLTGMSVGGQPLPIDPALFAIDTSGSGGVIVDSGTAVTRLKSGVYNLLRDAFKKGTQNLPSTTSVALFDTCYDLSSRTSVDVPTVAFNFAGGKSLRLPAKNYLIPVDNAGTFCFAFAPTSASLSIIGNVQQQGIRVSYDLARSVVGFSPSKC